MSLRSLYRDIAALRLAGARIDGERGYGYRLSEDPALPPQTLDEAEIEALALGLAEVQAMGDEDLPAPRVLSSPRSPPFCLAGANNSSPT